MSHRGSSLVPVNPYGLGFGPHGRNRLSLRGLGADETDYGIAARQASLDRSRQDRLERMQAQQDLLRREAEREKALRITQEAVQKARGTQVDILTAGQNQFRRLIFAGTGVAILALGAVTISSALHRKSRRSSGRSRKPSRRKKSASRRRSAKSPARVSSWRPTWKPRAASAISLGAAS